ncbi:MAG: ribosome assembly cofactor RimP [Bacteroidales bacterium]|nr:ribosome assembly cofactor RimP [Bacteroidales bacterium]
MNKKRLEDLLTQHLQDTTLFLVAVIVKPNNVIVVVIDSDSGVTIDDCVKVSRFVEGSLNRDEEDFELRVMSAGADTPFSTMRQYQKHIGKDVRITTYEGEKVEGILQSLNDISVVLEIAPVMKKGQKPGKNNLAQQRTFLFNDIKEAKALIKF